MARPVLALFLSLVLVPVIAAAHKPPRRPPPPPPPIAARIQAVRADVLEIEELVGRLEGQAKTAVEIQRRLDRIITELEQLEIDAGRPQVIIVEKERPTPPLVVVKPLPPPAPEPMVAADFDRVLEAIRAQSFNEEKQRVIQTALVQKTVAPGDKARHFSVAQIRVLMDLFSFSADKLEVVRSLWPQVLDKSNGFQLYEALTFSGDKETLTTILK